MTLQRNSRCPEGVPKGQRVANALRFRDWRVELALSTAPMSTQEPLILPPKGLEPLRGADTPHQLPKLARLPCFATAATAEVRAGVEPAYRDLRVPGLTVRPPHPFVTTSGQECNTAPGRFSILGSFFTPVNHSRSLRAGKALAQHVHHIGVPHAQAQTQSQETARAHSCPCEIDRPVERGRQARTRQEAPQTRLAEKASRQVAPTKRARGGESRRVPRALDGAQILRYSPGRKSSRSPQQRGGGPRAPSTYRQPRRASMREVHTSYELSDSCFGIVL